LSDTPVPQGSAQATPIAIDLNTRVLAYEDPLRKVDPVNITQQRVLEDALWWCINDAESTDDEIAQCFALMASVHEGGTVTFSEDDEALLMEKLPAVWGPAVLEKITRQK